MFQLVFLLAVFYFGALTPFAPHATGAEPAPGSNLVLILDASGSMWGKVDGQAKITVARHVLKDVIDRLPMTKQTGLVVYGHRRKGDCSDIETIAPLGPMDKATLKQELDALNPKGKTPITAAINAAIETVKSREDAATVVLVSDGLETCGGDPCAAVRGAKEAGVDFVMHVVGFDVGDVKVAQLECLAQAGEGLYFNAKNTEELTTALDAVVAHPPEQATGRLSIKTVASGKLVDSIVSILRAGSSDEVVSNRTYTDSNTNPRVVPLPDGHYDAEIRALGFKGDVKRRLEGIEVVSGKTVERVVDFSPGQLAVKVLLNGERSDATVTVYAAGEKRSVATGRTYKKPELLLELTPGDYDVVVKSVEVRAAPEQRLQGVGVEGGKRAEQTVEFQSGTLKIRAVQGGQLIDAVVAVRDPEAGRSVASGRTYTSTKTNPKVFEIPPGTYRVSVQAVKLKDKQKHELEVTIEPGKSVQRTIDFEP